MGASEKINWNREIMILAWELIHPDSGMELGSRQVTSGNLIHSWATKNWG